MKIRIKGNSIRLRLTKSEVSEFCEVGQLTKTTCFPNALLKYSLISDKSLEDISARFIDNQIQVIISSELIKNWDSSEQIGFHCEINVEDTSLSLKVEKDFVCLDERSEDQSDNYPNPKA